MDQYSILKSELMEIATKDSNAYFVCVDGMENILFSELRQKFPERVIQTGISETNTISFASGLALQGKTVFVAIPIFSSTKTFEQIRLDMVYNKANVKLLAVKSGIKYNSDSGYSHWCLEDIALMKTLSNLKILAPATLTDVKNTVRQAYEEKGPFYIRMENVHSDFERISFNTKYKNGAILATGAMVEDAVRYQNILKEAGFQVAVFNITQLSPFFNEIVLNLLKRKISIMTMEEHVSGGLSAIVSEIIARYGKKAKFLPFYLNAENANIVGNREYLMKNFMGTDESIVLKILHHCNKSIFYRINPIRTCVSLSQKNELKIQYKLLAIIPIARVKITNANRKYHLFGIHLYTKKENINE